MLKVIGGTPALSLLPPFTSSADVLASSGENPMKIVVLTGSPHRQGTSDLLADEFIAGATSKGHTIVRFDTAFEKVGSCRACSYCDKHNGGMYPKRRHAEDFAGNPVGGHDRAGHAAVLLQYDRPTENRSGSPDAAARGPAEAPHEIRDARHLRQQHGLEHGRHHGPLQSPSAISPLGGSGRGARQKRLCPQGH